RARRGARLAAITSGGAIPDTADYDVVEDPAGTFVGRLNEDFAIESMAGDVFLLGNTSWQIRRVEGSTVRVQDAHGAPPTIPFWLGEAPGRTTELSAAVSDLREQISARLGSVTRPAAIEWLTAETAVDHDGAEQLVDYIEETRAVLGSLPTTRRVIAERFFDEAGGMQLIIHAPFGARINRAWGLALRKRFCVTFDFELQAAATDDGILLSLGEQHSFPLDSVFSYLASATLEEVLVQAMLPSPMFTNRWRWNAGRSLALPRHSGGRRVPMPIQRMRAEDLLAAVFPDQVACQENRSGPLAVPDHPLVAETVRNCLHEAMDVEGLGAVVAGIEAGAIETRAVETAAPSAMSHEILNSNPYAFLDDAPLEERRARAVSLRRTDPDLTRGIGALDPAAIAEVCSQAWPEIRDADELHDHILTLCLLPEGDPGGRPELIGGLMETGRVTVATWSDGEGRSRRAHVAAERAELVRRALPEVRFHPALAAERRGAGSGDSTSMEEGLRAIVLGWIQSIGPTTAAALVSRLGLRAADVELALLALEGSGVVLRGRFSPGVAAEEWCERGLLARIHRLTVGRLRAEIEPVPPATLMRFLLRWQHAEPRSRLHGREGITEVISQLQGVELPAPAWEEHVLPSRIANYQAADLEQLCLAGVVAWGRVNPSPRPVEVDGTGEGGPRRPHGTGRNTPISFLVRDQLRIHLRPGEVDDVSPAAGAVAGFLGERGASFTSEIVAGTGRLNAEVEDALWELVARGRVSGDGIAGLRVLLSRADARGPAHPRFRALPGAPRNGRRPASGRWALWTANIEPASSEERCEAIARQLLQRWGVMVRELLSRERTAPPWRELLRVYRRWEAQGRVRGGRFIAGLAGEQFALPEAVEALRAVRRLPDDAAPAIVSAADPLNLVGILLPGARISPYSGSVIALVNGVPVDTGPLGLIRSHLGNGTGAPVAAGAG
ncbi:MAG: DEAD/DEAH box helicase, partial [Candidatus Dormibacteria bacterium]